VRFVLAMGLAASSIYSQAHAQPVVREAAGEYVVRVLVAPQLETTLASAMQGRLLDLNLPLGSRVAKGKTLVELDCGEQNARVAIAAADVAAARETHEAKLRLQGLQAAAEVDVALAAAALDKARAYSTLYRIQAHLCTVKAPFDGRIAKVHVKPHQSVTAGQPLVDIVQATPPKLRLNVPSKWLAWLTNGRVFTVVIDETLRAYRARVTAINARVDAASQTIELEASVEKAGPELLPGMSGTAQFDLP
jgi:membrane fusion protein, multidrug efflux system